MYPCNQERFRRLLPVFLAALSFTAIIVVLYSLLGVFLKVFTCALVLGLECLLGVLIGFLIPDMVQRELRIVTLLPAVLFYFYYHSISTWKLIDPGNWVEDFGFIFWGSCIIFPFLGFLLFGAIYGSIACGVRLRQKLGNKVPE